MKKLFVYLLLLCFSLYSNAQATDLTIDIQIPGTLKNQIPYTDQQTVKNLKVTGYINNTDIKFIGGLTQLSLNGVIDLGDVTIVGNSWNGSFKSASSSFSTSAIEDYPYSIQKLILPHSLTSYLEPKRSFFQSSVDTLVFDTQVNKIGDDQDNNGSDYYDTRYTFRRQIGHLILGENVDSLMYLPSDSPQTVNLPKSLKCIASYACKGRTDLSKWNIREFPSLEEIGYCSFTYDEPGYGHTGAIKNSETLPDSIFFPNMKWMNMACFDFKEGMHVFFGDKLEVIGSSIGNFSYPYTPSAENVSLHFKSKTPPAEVYGMHISSSCKLYVPKGSKQAYESAFNNRYNVIEEAQPLEGIVLDKESILMEVGDETTLTATPVPENADDADLILEVDKPEVVSITQSGEIKALSSGTAIITASSKDGKFTAKCTVIVKTHATEAYIDPSEVKFTKLGAMEQLQAVVLPEATYDKSVKWTSSNSSICSVTSTGKIVAMGYGDAVIMAITNDGEIPATCIVKVARPKYKFTYMVDGAEYKSYEVELNSPITPEAEPTKEGYTFSGWSEVPATMPEKDVIVNGSFVINKYKLTYIVDGETYKTDEFEYGKSVIPEAEPEKEGYSFSGWSMIPETMPAKDVTVTGSFTKGEYQLIYIVDGQVYKTIHMNYGDAVLVEDAPQKEGYTFSGWSEIPGTMPAKDIAVMGSFTVNSYKLTYTVDGEEYKSVQVNYGAAIIPEAEPTKEGYSFSGWGDIPATMPSCDVAVAGSFTVNSYKLIYMVDGEEYKIVDVAYGTSIIAEAEPTKEGYSFSGWGEIPATMPANDVTVTGSFTINKYTLVYVVDGENYVTYEVNYGTQIFPLPDLTKDGYTFSGWSDIPATMPAHDVTITGGFTFVDAIEGVLADDGEHQIYTLDGMPIETLQKGVNIIKYINGKVKKVVVK